MIKIRLVDTPEDANPCAYCVLSATNCDVFNCDSFSRKHFEFVEPEKVKFEVVEDDNKNQTR